MTNKTEEYDWEPVPRGERLVSILIWLIIVVLIIYGGLIYKNRKNIINLKAQFTKKHSALAKKTSPVKYIKHKLIKIKKFPAKPVQKKVKISKTRSKSATLHHKSVEKTPTLKPDRKNLPQSKTSVKKTESLKKIEELTKKLQLKSRPINTINPPLHAIKHAPKKSSTTPSDTSSKKVPMVVKPDYSKWWYAQVGAFSDITAANQLKKLLNENNYHNVFVVSANIKGKTWYRVRVGAKTEVQARKLATELKEKFKAIQDAYVRKNIFK